MKTKYNFSKLEDLKRRNRKIFKIKSHLRNKIVIELVDPSQYLKKKGYRVIHLNSFYRFLNYLEVHKDEQLFKSLGIDKTIVDFYIIFNGFPLENGFTDKQLQELKKVSDEKLYTVDDLWLEIRIRENNKYLAPEKIYIKVWEQINLAYYNYLLSLDYQDTAIGKNLKRRILR